MPPKAVPRVYGEGENFELYLNHFNRIALANEWTEQAKLAYLETKLTGKAQREFEVFIEEEPDISFDDITEKIAEELAPSSQKALELFTDMRLEDKSPKEFYGALVRQSRLAHGTMGEHARHIIVRTQMMQVLPKKLRQDAAMQGYLADMQKEEFLTLLTRVYDAEMRDLVSETYEPTISQVKSHPIEDRVKKLEEREEKREKEMSELVKMVREMHTGRQNNSYRPRSWNNEPRSWNNEGQKRGGQNTSRASGCFKCLQDGHLARDCPNGVKCTKCFETGHMRYQCPKN